MNVIESIVDQNYISKSLVVETTRFHLNVRKESLFSLDQLESILGRVWLWNDSTGTDSRNREAIWREIGFYRRTLSHFSLARNLLFSSAV